MQKYFYVLKYFALKYKQYPLEAISKIITRLLGILYLVIFWHLVLGESNIRHLISYFLIASGVFEITFSNNTKVGRAIRKDVLSGEMARVVVKPVSIIFYYYCKTIGDQIVGFVIALFCILAGIFLVDNLTVFSLLEFLILIFIAAISSIAFNMFEGALSIIFTEVSGIKNALNHTMRVLSGALVPLYLFPENIKSIVELLPFKVIVYSPVNALTGSEQGTFVKSFFIGIFWMLLLNFIIYRFWIFSLKKYEAAGT